LIKNIILSPGQQPVSRLDRFTSSPASTLVGIRKTLKDCYELHGKKVRKVPSFPDDDLEVFSSTCCRKGFGIN
jgi:hypothetical protein